MQTRGARADWGPGRSFRPAARRSLTDSPLVDAAGDLWFLEAGANRITRIAGVGAPTPAVAARPDVDVDLSADTLAIRGLTDATSADVVVERGGREVARAAGVAVSGGAVRVTAWPVADALRPGDVVTVRPIGAGLQAAFATELPALSAARHRVRGRGDGAARRAAAGRCRGGRRRPPGADRRDGRVVPARRRRGGGDVDRRDARCGVARAHRRGARARAVAVRAAAPSAPATPSSPAPSPTPSAAPPASDTAGEVAAQPVPAPAQPHGGAGAGRDPEARRAGLAAVGHVPADLAHRHAPGLPRHDRCGRRGLPRPAGVAPRCRPPLRPRAVARAARRSRRRARARRARLDERRRRARGRRARPQRARGPAGRTGRPRRAARGAAAGRGARGGRPDHGSRRRVQRIEVRDVARAWLDRRGRALLGPAS